jgi:hypothetical protein
MLTQTAEVSESLVQPHAPIVHLEQEWFALPDGDTRSLCMPRIRAGRWTGYTQKEHEECSQIGNDHHVVGIALRPMTATAFAENKLVHSGWLPQGAMRVNEPGIALRGIFSGNYDVLHLHIPNTLIAECTEAEMILGAHCGRRSFRRVGNPVAASMGADVGSLQRWRVAGDL